MLTKPVRLHHGTAETAKIKIQGNRKPKADRDIVDQSEFATLLRDSKYEQGPAFCSLNHRLRHFSCTLLCIIRERIIISINSTKCQPIELWTWTLDTEFRFLVKNQRSNAVTLFRSTTKPGRVVSTTVRNVA